MCKIEDVYGKRLLSKTMNRFFFGLRSVPAAAWLVFAIAFVLGAQDTQQPPANSQNQTPPSGSAPNQPKSPSAPANPPAGGAPVDSNSYKTGPSDVLLIRVWNEPEFSGPVAVQQNGNITIPLVGELPAGGKTPIEIQDMHREGPDQICGKAAGDRHGPRCWQQKLLHRRADRPSWRISASCAHHDSGSHQQGRRPADFANAKQIYILRGDQTDLLSTIRTCSAASTWSKISRSSQVTTSSSLRRVSGRFRTFICWISLSVPRRPFDFEDYIDILRRNMRWIIAPAFAGLSDATVVAFMMEDTFVSSALIRVTPQQINPELVQNVTSQDVAERINGMAQTILSRGTLTRLISHTASIRRNSKASRWKMSSTKCTRAIDIRPVGGSCHGGNNFCPRCR